MAEREMIDLQAEGTASGWEGRSAGPRWALFPLDQKRRLGALDSGLRNYRSKCTGEQRDHCTGGQVLPLSVSPLALVQL